LKLKISTEVQRKKFNYRLDGLHFYQDFDGLGFNDSHIIYDSKAIIVAVPVTVEYLFGTKKVLPFIALGLAPEFILETTDGTIYYSDGTTDPTATGGVFRKSNVVAFTGAGIYYRAANKISLSIGPEFNYSLQGDMMKMHRYSFALIAGAFYNL
jgi:hypothetical protein